MGTIKAYCEAHKDLLGEKPPFELNNAHWIIYPAEYTGPGAKILNAVVKNSLISEGVTVVNAKIKNSIIRRGVTIEGNVSIEGSIVMDHSVVKQGSRLRKVIVDKWNVIFENERIGFDPKVDRFRCHVDPSGIAIIPKGGRPLDPSKSNPIQE